MNPSVPVGMTADRILAPFGLDRFISEHWGQRHLILQRDDPTRYDELFSLADIDRYLALASEAGVGRLSLIDNGKVTRRVAPKGIDVRQLYAALDGGSTILLEAIDQVWPPLREFAANLSRTFSAKVKVNVYLTPPGRQGAPIHPDIQDVFVLQLEGAKEWHLYEETVYEGVESLRHFAELGYVHPGNPENPTPLPIVTLEPGDLLYMPRGVLHRAVAPEDRPSLHLTVCANPVYWVDFLKVAVESASLARPELADPLPPGFEWNPDSPDLQETFERALELVKEGTSYGTIAKAYAHLRTRQTPADGHFARLLKLEEITIETAVEVRVEGPIQATESDSKAHLRCGAIQLQGPAGLLAVFEFVRDHPRFQVSDLPDNLSVDAKVNLIKRLMKKGLLREVKSS